MFGKCNESLFIKSDRVFLNLISEKKEKKSYCSWLVTFQIRITHFSWFLVNLNTAWLTPNAWLLPRSLGFKRFKMNGIVFVTAWYLFVGRFTCNHQLFLLIPWFLCEPPKPQLKSIAVVDYINVVLKGYKVDVQNRLKPRITQPGKLVENNLCYKTSIVLRGVKSKNVLVQTNH